MPYLRLSSTGRLVRCDLVMTCNCFALRETALDTTLRRAIVSKHITATTSKMVWSQRERPLPVVAQCTRRIAWSETLSSMPRRTRRRSRHEWRRQRLSEEPGAEEREATDARSRAAVPGGRCGELRKGITIYAVTVQWPASRPRSHQAHKGPCVRLCQD